MAETDATKCAASVTPTDKTLTSLTINTPWVPRVDDPRPFLPCLHVGLSLRRRFDGALFVSLRCAFMRIGGSRMLGSFTVVAVLRQVSFVSGKTPFRGGLGLLALAGPHAHCLYPQAFGRPPRIGGRTHSPPLGCGHPASTRSAPRSS